MTDTMTSQNIDLSSWDTLYINKMSKHVALLNNSELSCVDYFLRNY